MLLQTGEKGTTAADSGIYFALHHFQVPSELNSDAQQILACQGS
jgi:hypothetical protein